MFGYRVPAPDEAMLVSGGKYGKKGAPFRVVVGLLAEAHVVLRADLPFSALVDGVKLGDPAPEPLPAGKVLGHRSHPRRLDGARLNLGDVVLQVLAPTVADEGAAHALDERGVVREHRRVGRRATAPVVPLSLYG